MYDGKVVLVTGSSRGVGLEICRHFIKHNARVIGISRGESSFHHEHYTHCSLDIGDPDAISFCFRNEIRKRYSHLDIVINNAAVLTSQYSMIMPVKNAVEMVHVNLLGTFFISREAAKLMRSKKSGRIINIGSMASVLEPAGDSIYAATKAAIISLANVMAKEFSTLNITCNTLAVSAVDTDMLQSHTEVAKAKIAEIVSRLPVPRIAENDDIMNVIDFFSSERSSYITGQTIYLGGIS